MNPDAHDRLNAGFLSPGRLEAFSDGVFAIAITLLVLELDVPTGGDDLLRELAHEWPSYLGYLVSFVFIGGVWVAHATLSKFLKAVDQVLLGLNLVLLLLVTLLPFTSKLMATHLNDAGEHAAVVIFGLNLTLASLMVNLTLSYASTTDGLCDRAGDRDLAAFARQRRVAIVVMAVATALGLFLPAVAVAVYLLISLFALVDPIWRAVRNRRRIRHLGDDGVPGHR